MKKAWPFAVVASLAVTSVATWNFTRSSEVNADENGSNAKIKNVIVLIGDGMESTEFDKHLVGTQKTYPEDEHENITDSASAATAMSAGIKTYNAAIAVDNDKALC